jgi:UDP-glucose:(glucosyl)LPS alpha-1,3-glucosyltransferase/UDP-glucose:(galactosyl)LPS alpha-1,2-glucosyltransferase
MNLAITFDKNYQKWAAVCLNSILDTYSGEDNINLIIITDLEYRQFIGQLKESLKKFQFLIFDFSSAFDNLPTGFHFTKAMYGLLAMPSLLSAQGIEKALYIDLDILVLEDLNILFNVDLGDYYCGGVLDIHSSNKDLQNRLSLKQGFVINSGVLLMNVQKMNSIDWKTQANELHNQGKIKWGDQDVINMLLDQKIMILDQKWNVQSGNFQNGYDGDVSIVHFTESNNSKPWSIKSKHRYLGVYNTYMRKSGFYIDYLCFETIRRIRKLSIFT